MSRRRKAEATREPSDQDSLVAPVDDDAEGHSIGLLLGMVALDEANRASDRAPGRQRIAEDLAPMTKKWPNLREAAASDALATAAENAQVESVGDAAPHPVLGARRLGAPSQS